MTNENKRALYFGCLGRNDLGHFLHDGGSSTLRPERWEVPWQVGLMDTGLLKNREIPDTPTGEVQCIPAVGWFAFVWWDRSGDSRPNSNSGFYVEGFETHEVLEAFKFALTQWPKIVERQRYKLRLLKEEKA